MKITDGPAAGGHRFRGRVPGEPPAPGVTAGEGGAGALGDFTATPAVLRPVPLDLVIGVPAAGNAPAGWN